MRIGWRFLISAVLLALGACAGTGASANSGAEDSTPEPANHESAVGPRPAGGPHDIHLDLTVVRDFEELIQIERDTHARTSSAKTSGVAADPFARNPRTIR